MRKCTAIAALVLVTLSAGFPVDGAACSRPPNLTDELPELASMLRKRLNEWRQQSNAALPVRKGALQPPSK